MLLLGCAPLEVKQPTPQADIQVELDKASNQTVQAAAMPPAVAEALAPKVDLRMDSPAAAPKEPRFDLAINDAPAREVFLAIATGTRYSMLLAPELSGQISVRLKNVTVPEAMAALRELYGYDYRIEGDRIFVQANTAHTRFYTIPYPTAVRQGRSELRVSSGSIADNPPRDSNATAEGGATATRIDNSRVETAARSDFWQEIKDAVALLIGCNPTGCPTDRSVVVSPQTGTLAVRATAQEHRLVAEYLRSARLVVERQVMIEAKIIEVTLNEGAQSGINWAFFNKGNSLSKGADSKRLDVPKSRPQPTTTVGELLGGGLAASGGALPSGPAHAGLFGLALQTTNFMSLIDFLKTQGEVQVLSSPRIAALNNQKAVLKVGTDEFFVTGISTNTTTSGATTTTSPTVTVQPFFSGIALDITPHIDDTGHIILHVHPSVSTVTTNNKEIDLGDLGLYRLPLASSAISQADSIVRLKDGEIAAIGGLMTHAAQDSSSGVPGLADIPGLGALFRNTASSRQKRELVILLKPTLIRQTADWAAGVSEVRARLQ